MVFTFLNVVVVVWLGAVGVVDSPPHPMATTTLIRKPLNFISLKCLVVGWRLLLVVVHVFLCSPCSVSRDVAAIVLPPHLRCLPTSEALRFHTEVLFR